MELIGHQNANAILETYLTVRKQLAALRLQEQDMMTLLDALHKSLVVMKVEIPDDIEEPEFTQQPTHLISGRQNWKPRKDSMAEQVVALLQVNAAGMTVPAMATYLLEPDASRAAIETIRSAANQLVSKDWAELNNRIYRLKDEHMK